MALSFSNCLIPLGSGVNKMYADCCCNIQCTVTNTSNDVQTIISTTEQQVSDWLFDNILINGLPLTLPIVLVPNQSFLLSFDLCAGALDSTEQLKFSYDLAAGGIEHFPFDFQSVDLSTSVNISLLDFGNVVIGTSVSAPVTVTNPTTCCYSYNFISACKEVTTTSTTTNNLCTNNSQTIGVIYSPTTLGAFACTVNLSNDCGVFNVDVIANAIMPDPASGSLNGQKNKVDQTSTVAPCSPRTINNQCNTGQAASAAITSRAQTITRPAGGAGRGKGFSK